MATSSLIKTSLRNSIAEGIYNEIVNRNIRYYYFLGRTLTWGQGDLPPFPVDSYNYEKDTRREMITLKEIKPTDVSFVIDRYDWESGVVYDQYDDQYSTEVQGINLIDGGREYFSIPKVYIGSAGSTSWTPGGSVTRGDFIKATVGTITRYYIVFQSGTLATTAPTHDDGVLANGTALLEHVVVTDGNGYGAAAEAVIFDGKVIDVVLTKRGTDYTEPPSVWIAGDGSFAYAQAVVTRAPSGAQKLEDARFYVVTDEFNVYKCINNNNGSASTVKPTGTNVEPVISSDGYIWKFLFNVPIALRNKFLNTEYIPVTTALKNQFYSNGEIQTVRIDQPGTGYTAGSITVTGDGYLEDDPLYLSNYVIVDGGENYTSATLEIELPFSDVFAWTANTVLTNVGQKLLSNNNVYEVVITGVTGSLNPTHKKGTVANGTAALRYIGTRATATATISSGAITAVQFNGMLRDINMVNFGSGYNSVPAVTFSGGGGTGADATAVLQNGRISKVIINDPGQNYTSEPTIKFGTEWTASTVVTLNQQIFYANRLYTVTTAGTTGTTAPTHSTVNGVAQSATNGTATLLYAGQPASATVSLKYGAGYSGLPLVNIISNSGSGAEIRLTGIKSEAKLVPYFEDGQLKTVQIDNGGVGYTYANIVLTGNGTDAALSVDLSPGNINTQQANIELLTVAGRIYNIPVISGGYGYTAASVTIDGDGTGATAEATVVNGAVTKITVTNYGSGYNWATITITGYGSGTGAKARAIISPYGGHGKYSTKELFSRILMFYTNVSADQNQGFDVNNDYRQLGIIKNVKKYNSTNALTSSAASACWVVSSTINTTQFPQDAIIKNSEGKRFRIVANTGTSALLQSLDNATITSGSILTDLSGVNFFNVVTATAPTADKYSGDLLFIDNKDAFTPTREQSVVLRTIIRF